MLDLATSVYREVVMVIFLVAGIDLGCAALMRGSREATVDDRD